MPMLMRLKALANVSIKPTSTAGASAQQLRLRQPSRASHARPTGPAASSGMGVLTASATR